MEKKMKNKLIPVLVATLSLVFISSGSSASSFDNLERERALTILKYMDTDMGEHQRIVALEDAKRRLLDLERIALQEKNLRGFGSYKAIRAFSDYEKTFLVHASAENEKNIIIHWMDSIGLTSSSINNARIVK
jgi:hypothetical protein